MACDSLYESNRIGVALPRTARLINRRIPVGALYRFLPKTPLMRSEETKPDGVQSPKPLEDP